MNTSGEVGIRPEMLLDVILLLGIHLNHTVSTAITAVKSSGNEEVGALTLLCRCRWPH